MFTIPLPGDDGAVLDIVDGSSSAVQRALRRDGLAEYEPTTMAALLALWHRRPIDEQVFYDIGSNVGLYAAVCALMSGIEVVAFEPTPSTARIARGIFERNRLDIRHVEAAVGEQAGTAELFLSATSDASNSLVEGFKRSTGSVTVPVVAIDEVAGTEHPLPSVIKIDVETFEPAVLRGAIRTLETVRPYVVVEVLKRRGVDHGPSIEAVVADLGYHYYRLGPTPRFKPRAHIVGKQGTVHRDWLLAPEPLTPDFVADYARWRELLATCTVDRNSRLPVGRTVAVMVRDHGVGVFPIAARVARRRVARFGARARAGAVRLLNRR